MLKKLVIIFFVLIGGLAYANPPATQQPLLLMSQLPAILTYNSTASQEGNTAVNTFTSMSCPSPTSDRIMFVGVAGRTGSTGTSISSVTVAGISATVVVNLTIAGNVSGENNVAIYKAPLPTGTSCTVVVTYSAAYARSAVSLWAATGVINSTASDAGSSSALAPTKNLNIPLDGFGLSIAYTQSATSTTWTGLVEDNDFTGGSFINTYSSAHLNLGNPSLTSTATFASPLASAGVFASFR